MSINLGFFRVGVMRQSGPDGSVTFKTVGIKPSFGKPGDQDGGVSGFRALFVGSGHSIAYLLKRTAQSVKIRMSFRDLTKVRNKHDKASKAEMARLDKKIQKNPDEQKFKDLKTSVVESRVSAARDAVNQAVAKKIVADENKASHEKTISTLTAAIDEKRNATGKGSSVQGEGESGISPNAESTDHAESADASQNQGQPKTVRQLVKERNKADRELRLANHAAKAAAQRVKNEEAALNYWTADSGMAIKALADAVHNIGALTHKALINEKLATSPMPADSEQNVDAQ